MYLTAANQDNPRLRSGKEEGEEEGKRGGFYISITFPRDLRDGTAIKTAMNTTDRYQELLIYLHYARLQFSILETANLYCLDEIYTWNDIVT